MENGKWKIETLPSFSIFRFPFSVDKARASAFLMLLVQNAKFKHFWCKAEKQLKAQSLQLRACFDFIRVFSIFCAEALFSQAFLQNLRKLPD
jgi:hypothetical protein